MLLKQAVLPIEDCCVLTTGTFLHSSFGICTLENLIVVCIVKVVLKR